MQPASPWAVSLRPLRDLRGKHKVDFTPNVDCGDFVIIVNADKAVLTGKKLDQKHYYRITPAGSAT